MYYNESNGLYYTDEGFTTLANGFDWNSWSGYYIEGALTTLNAEGFGTWNDVFYAYGTPDSNFTGADPWDGYYYIASQLTTLDYDGNGEWNGDNYANGVIVIPAKNGWIDGVYYKNDVATTLDEDGNGTWNGVTFVNGDRPDGLLAFYKLSDLTDSSGNNRTLTNNGNVSFASGKLGNAAVFDGSNYLVVNEFISNLTEFTFSCWLKTTTQDGVIFDSEGNGILNAMACNEGGTISFNLKDGWNPVRSTTYVNDDSWHHCVGVFDGASNTGKVFIDGVLEGIDNTFPSYISQGDTIISLGKVSNLEWAYLIGQIDAVGIWNRALSDAEVAELYNTGTGLELEVPNLNNGLQAFYKLSDLTDSSGNNRTLTNNGNVSFASGKIGNAAVFNGNNYLSRPQQFMAGASKFSFACFVKCTSTTTYIYGEDDFGSNFLLVSTHDNKATFNFQFDWNPLQSTSTITDDQWHHVVCVYDGGVSAKLYFDGVQEASRNSVAATMPIGQAANFSFAGPPTGWGAMLNGSMDAVGIWNRALSDAEVAELYNAGTGLEVDPPNYRGEWDNYTDYGQDDVVSVSGVYWKLTGLGGWTVGGAPGLGYGWTLLVQAPVGGKVSLSGRISLSGRVKFAV